MSPTERSRADTTPAIGERSTQLAGKLLPLAGSGAVELDVHHRFAPVLVVTQGDELAQHAFLVTRDADHRVKQAMDRELPCGDHVGDRIDEERHVVVDDPDPHTAAPGLSSGRLDLEGDVAALPACGDLGKEFRGFPLSFARQAVGLSRQGIPGQRLANGFDQRLGQARMDGHETD